MSFVNDVKEKPKEKEIEKDLVRVNAVKKDAEEEVVSVGVAEKDVEVKKKILAEMTASVKVTVDVNKEEW